MELPELTSEQEAEIARRTNEAYARLRTDPDAWAAEQAERVIWDTTLMDGLEDEPPYDLSDGSVA